ncbi:MAG: SRPBCC family protein [Flavobacterium sp.]
MEILDIILMCKKLILTAIGLLIGAGTFAQNNSTMRSINNHAPVKCSKTITINSSSEKVWAVMTNIDNWANWQTEITKPKLNGELKPETTFDWKTGGAKIHSTLHTVEPFKYFGWTGKTFGMIAIHNWTLIEKNGKTTVTVDESMEGFFAQLLKNSFNKSLEKGMQNWLNLLKIECEK